MVACHLDSPLSYRGATLADSHLAALVGNRPASLEEEPAPAEGARHPSPKDLPTTVTEVILTATAIRIPIQEAAVMVVVLMDFVDALVQ